MAVVGRVCFFLLSPCLLAFLAAAGSASASSSLRPPQTRVAAPVPQLAELAEDGVIRVWALSDIQPRTEWEKAHFLEAVDDVNRNVPGIDLAVVAGDLVKRPSRARYEWYLAVRDSSYVEHWYEIAGNHDIKSDGGALYRELVQPRMHFSFAVEGLLFIMMSDEEPGAPTDISEETFRWWKRLVEENQDKIIVVVTHAPLEGSRIPLSHVGRRQIRDSERFRRVLRSKRVDLWLNGHNHVPHWFPYDVSRVAELGGTVFVNVSAIRKEFMKHSESRILEFRCGSDQVVIRSRDHTKERFNDRLERRFDLSKPLRCDGTAEREGRAAQARPDVSLNNRNGGTPSR